MDKEMAKMFNNMAKDPFYKSEEIIKALNIKKGFHIIDIGAGGGFYSLKFAQLVGSEGKVYSIDLQDDFINYIQQQAQEKGLQNIDTLKLSEKEIIKNKVIPRNSIDLIFMRNVVHHLSDRMTYISALKNYLKPDGKIAIIDYTPEGNAKGYGPPGHFVDPKKLKEEIKTGGLDVEKEFDFLEVQFFFILRKPAI